MASPAHTPGYAGPPQAPYQAYQPAGSMQAPPYQAAPPHNEKAVQHHYHQQQIHQDHAHAGHQHGPPANRGPGGPPGDWNASYCGFCSPFDLCCLTYWLPCVTFGKTHHRLRWNGNMENYSDCNGSCWLFCGAACFGVHWIPMMMQRTDVREKYGIDGSCFGDCCSACCCPLCDLVQAEKEVKGREQHGTGPVNQQYQAHGGMHM